MSRGAFIILLGILSLAASFNVACRRKPSASIEKQKPVVAGKPVHWHVEIDLDNGALGNVTADFRPSNSPKSIKTIDNLRLGSMDLTLTDLPDGDYSVHFKSPGFSPRWQQVKLDNGTITPDITKLHLFRKRYVLIRYSFNPSGSPDFSGNVIEEGRAAVSQSGGLPSFGTDWRIGQKFPNGSFGDTPYLIFHRYNKGFGFCKAPRGIEFDDLKQAPTNEVYHCNTMKAEKGLTLFCRVNGNREEGLGYGKLVVEDVTETPPAGITLIESPY